MDCVCVPNLSYISSNACEVNYDSSFLLNFNTYGLFLGIGIVVFLYNSIIFLENNFFKFVKLIVIPSVVGLSFNIFLNFFHNNSIISLNTLYFTIGLFIAWSFVHRKSNHILIYFLFGLTFAKYGCHISGDGHWGKILTNKDYSYELFKDCKYKHNVINQGVILENCTVKYNRELNQPRFPMPLLESLSILIFALVIYIFFLDIKYYKFIANIFILIKSLVNSLLQETTDASVFFIFLLSLTIMAFWCLDYFFKISKFLINKT